MDLKKEILNYLDSIKNEFNELKIKSRQDNIDNQLKRVEKFMPKITSGKISIAKIMELVFGHLKVEPITTLKHVTLFEIDGIWCIKKKHSNGWSDVLRLNKNNYTKQDAFNKAKEIDAVYTRGYTVINKLYVPTGQLVFANYFLNTKDEYAFKLPENLYFKEKYSINTKYGRQNSMNYLAKNYNLGYAQLGNTTAAIFKIDDNRLIIAPEYYYNDITDEEVSPLKNWKYLGDISCSVWRIEFTDKATIDNHKTFNHKHLEKEDNVVIKVNPGVWSIQNYYHDKSDNDLAKKFGYPIWVELNKQQ